MDDLVIDISPPLNFAESIAGGDRGGEVDQRRYVKYTELVTELRRSLDIDFEKIKEGYQLRLITNNAVNAIVVIDAIMRQFEILELYMCVYRMNLKSVQFLKTHIHDKGIRATVLLSSFFRENKKYERWFHEIVGLQNERFTVKTGCLHAKVFVCKTKGGGHYVFEGSGNLSDNARIEQYLLENNAETYSFHARWMSAY